VYGAAVIVQAKPVVVEPTNKERTTTEQRKNKERTKKEQRMKQRKKQRNKQRNKQRI
jgi:hypothetical protein